ncbi:hypothetical protein niasHT_003410 [Heterodera trifolii]|uniref:Serine/threonine-protein phosphatase n=1 Tax=Heterodera trifolii TaxID=157864 RepID=A0ABD2M754_9BILA
MPRNIAHSATQNNRVFLSRDIEQLRVLMSSVEEEGSDGRADEMANLQIDGIIYKVMHSTYGQFPLDVTEHDLRQLCDATMDVFRQQQTLVRIQPPVNVCGDIHGQFTDLLRIFSTLGPPPEKKYLFLGDYVDRGPQSLETVVLLFCYKVKYPESVTLLRGNHECSNINRVYGFYSEIEQRYQQADTRRLFDMFNQTFAWMPYVGLIGDRILCMHGGISDRITSLQQLNELRRPLLTLPSPSLEMDLLWADPMLDIRGVEPSPRGAGVVFGEDVVFRICEMLNINYIIRAHELVLEGIEYFADERLVTVFSVPRYHNQMNTGAALTIAEDLSHDVTFFPPT